MRRLSGRRVCVKDQHNFHVDFDPPKHPDRCDLDGSRLVVRDDDQPEVVKHRLEQYHEKTEPLIGYYEQREHPAPGRRLAQPDEVATRSAPPWRRCGSRSRCDHPQDTGARSRRWRPPGEIVARCLDMLRVEVPARA